LSKKVEESEFFSRDQVKMKNFLKKGKNLTQFVRVSESIMLIFSLHFLLWKNGK